MPFTIRLREDDYEDWVHSISTAWTVFLRDKHYMRSSWKNMDQKLDGLVLGLIHCTDLIHSKDSSRVYDLIVEDVDFLRAIAAIHAARAPRSARIR